MLGVLRPSLPDCAILAALHYQILCTQEAQKERCAPFVHIDFVSKDAVYKRLVPDVLYGSKKPDWWRTEIDAAHKNYDKFTPEQARLETLKLASSLENYGANFYFLKKTVRP